MNIQTGQWDGDLLKIFSIPENILPKISPSSGVFGYTKNVPGLPDGIPISGMAGDQQAALFGQTCFKVGEAKCTFGTGSFILMNTGNQKQTAPGMLTTVAWQLAHQKRMTYALEGGAFICGAAVQWLRDEIKFFSHSSEIEALAQSVPDSGGVEFVPAMVGLGSPHWNPQARGTITGLTRGSHRGHLARATLDAMALQNVDILQAMKEAIEETMKKPMEKSMEESMKKTMGEAMTQSLDKNLQELRVDGGAAKNNFLMQLQSDYLGSEILRPEVQETTVLGAAYLAGLGVGFWSDIENIQKVWRIKRKFQPKISQTQRHQRLKSWHKALRQCQTC